MEILRQKSSRRSTRLRVQIPVLVTSLDRMRPFVAKCVAVVVSAQGCGLRSSQALQVETPVLLSDLPGGGSVTARVLNCLPVGNEGFLIGAALYTHGNVWGIANPPEDWRLAELNYPAPASGLASGSGSGSAAGAQAAAASAAKLAVNKKVWPYNLAAEVNSGRK